MFGTIYKITNIFNNKVYVGQTWEEADIRFSRHKRDKYKKCPKLFRAFEKYGRDNFKVQVILFAHTQLVLDYWEKYFIKKYDSIKNGYNCTTGGATGKHSEESKRKMSKAKIGRKLSERTKKKISQNCGMRKLKTRIKASRSKSKKTNYETRQEIKLLYLSGVSQKEIAKKYKITQSYVSRVVNSRRNY